MADLRGIVGSATFSAYMGLYHGGSGDMTLFEKLRSLMGSLEGLRPYAGSGERRTERHRQPHRWRAADPHLHVEFDPTDPGHRDRRRGWQGHSYRDPTGERPYIPYGVNQVVEVHRDLS